MPKGKRKEKDEETRDDAVDDESRKEAARSSEDVVDEDSDAYHFDISEYDSIGEPVGITHLFLNSFLNAASPDPNTRIVALKTILMLSQPFTNIETPKRPGWQSSVNKAGRMISSIGSLDEGERQVEAVRWGMAQRVYDEDYEDSLRDAVNEAMKILIKERLLNWSEMFGQAPSIRPNEGMDSFRLRGGR